MLETTRQILKETIITHIWNLLKHRWLFTSEQENHHLLNNVIRWQGLKTAETTRKTKDVRNRCWLRENILHSLKEWHSWWSKCWIYQEHRKHWKNERCVHSTQNWTVSQSPCPCEYTQSEIGASMGLFCMQWWGSVDELREQKMDGWGRTWAQA